MIEVSIIIPCRNEQKHIGKCLDSIVKSDFPKEKLEVLVVDGVSEDKTREIVKEYIKKNPFIRLLDNPKKFTPFALNIGIRGAKGEVIIRADAHAQYDEDYISKSVRYLLEYKKDNKTPDNVGGVIEVPSTEHTTIKTRAIALCLSHPFGSASLFRLGVKEPRWADTVFGGCYRREVFNKYMPSPFNENLIRSQDLEFNLRLKKDGGNILLVPDISLTYYPKSSFWEFFKHNFEDGIWAIYPLKFTKTSFSFRHYLPFVFVSSLLGTGLLSTFSPIFFYLFSRELILYVFVNLCFSAIITIKEKDLRYAILMPLAFICRHFGYGLGSIMGLIKIIKK
jgi:glycosyltransferase involved in cell wall biosynthesis